MRGPARCYQAIVYRMFNEANELLYVGFSSTGHNRIEQHVHTSWYRDVHRVETTRYATDSEAIDAEERAIRTEHPLHNRAGVTHRYIRPAPRRVSPVWPDLPTPPPDQHSWRRSDASEYEDCTVCHLLHKIGTPYRYPECVAPPPPPERIGKFNTVPVPLPATCEWCGDLIRDHSPQERQGCAAALALPAPAPA